jgi:acetyl-CoA carboxylase biotin carboxyl carrier protein
MKPPARFKRQSRTFLSILAPDHFTNADKSCKILHTPLYVSQGHLKILWILTFLMSKTFSIDGESVRQLAQILNETNLTEIEYEEKGSRIRIVRLMSSNTTSIHTGPQTSGLNPMMGSGFIPYPPPGGSSPFFPSEGPPSSCAPPPAPPAPAATANQTTIYSPMVGTVYLAPQPGASLFISVGAQVSKGDTLVIVEAMKVMNPIKATTSGRISQILVQDGQIVEYDTPLVTIE